MITILVYSVGTLLSGMATGMWTLFLARAITGIGVGGEWAVAHALVGETVPPHVRGRYGSYLQSGSAFARFFASMVGNLLAPWIGWRAAFMLSALPALIVVVIRRQMPESDVWLQSVKSGVGRNLGYVAALGQMLGPALRKTTTLALTVTTFNMAAYWFKTIWLPTYLHDTRGLANADVAWLLLMDQIGSVRRLHRVRLRQRFHRPAPQLHHLLGDQGHRAADGHARLDDRRRLYLDDVRLHAARRLRRRQLGLHRPAAERSLPDIGARRGARHHLQHRARRAVPGAGRHQLGRDANIVRRRHRARGTLRAAGGRGGLDAAGNQRRPSHVRTPVNE
jgi:hypothetical protein